MITLEYWDGKTWIQCGGFVTDRSAWLSLGTDCLNYRTVRDDGSVVTDNSATTQSDEKAKASPRQLPNPTPKDSL